MLVAPRIFTFHDINDSHPSASLDHFGPAMFGLVLVQECTVSMLRYIVHSRNKLKMSAGALGRGSSRSAFIPSLKRNEFHSLICSSIVTFWKQSSNWQGKDSDAVWSIPKVLWYTLTDISISKLQKYVWKYCLKGHVYSMFRALSEHNASDCCVCEAQLWVQCIPVSTLLCGAHATRSRLWVELTKTSAPCGALMPAWTCLNLPACLQADLEKSHQTISELTLAELTVS